MEKTKKQRTFIRERHAPLRVLFFSQSFKRCFQDSLAYLKHLSRERVPNLEVLCVVPDDTTKPWVEYGFKGLGLKKRESIFEAARKFNPHLIVSMLYPKRIEDEILESCPEAINFHPSLLPKHRGSLTQFWAIFDGDTETGCTCHRMVHDFDAGLILLRRECIIEPDETALTLQIKMQQALFSCFQDIMNIFVQNGSLPPGDQHPQHDYPYHWHRFPRKGEIDTTWPRDKIDRFIRAMYCPPFAPAHLPENLPSTNSSALHSMMDRLLMLISAAPETPVVRINNIDEYDAALKQRAERKGIQRLRRVPHLLCRSVKSIIKFPLKSPLVLLSICVALFGLLE